MSGLRAHAGTTADAHPCLDYEAPALDPQVFNAIHKTLGCAVFDSRVGTFDLPPLHTKHGKLSTLWAQEEVGADLSKDLLARWDSDYPEQPSRVVPLGVLDVGMQLKGIDYHDLSSGLRACRKDPSKCPAYGSSEHGTRVANLMVGSVGVAGKARISRVDDGAKVAGGDIAAAYRHMADPGPDRPEVVNMSIGMGQLAPSAREALDRLSEGAIAVHASGNSYPAPLDPYLAQTHGIVVGALSPEGLMSSYSSAGDAVTISAPSDYEITTVGPGDAPYQRDFTDFSGTSAAAPLVSGAIANVLSLLPGMTTDEVKVLLRHTAIQTSAFQPADGKNGAGSLNAYAMLRVAARLKLGVWPGSGRPGAWPKNRELLREPLPDAGLFDFADESASLKVRGLALLKNLDCDQQKEAVRLLRTAFFLNPRDPGLRGALAETYRANELVAQASFIEGRPARESLDRIENPGVRLALGLRAGMSPETLFPSTSARRAAYLEAFQRNDIFDETLVELARHAFADSAPSVRSAFLSARPAHYPGWGKKTLDQAALEHARDPALRASAIRDACAQLIARFVNPLLAIARADASPWVRKEAAGCISTCSKQYAADLASPDRSARARAREDAEACQRIGRPE